MAIDEFGREVPAGRGVGPRSPSHYGPEDPAYLNGALPTGRYDDATSSGPPPLSRGRPPYLDHRGGGGPRKRKHRDDSPEQRGPSRRHNGNPNSSCSSSKSPHPSTLYAEEPMLCHFLWKEKPDQEESYDEYRKSYCLNYIRTFFNQHMDDSWFRDLYSPLSQLRLARQERARATQEAKVMMEELNNSIAKNTGESSKCFFVLKGRLGGGVKQTSAPRSGTTALTNQVPGTHVISLAHRVLPISEVPPHVTDEQLLVALLANVKGLKRDDLHIYSSSVAGNGNLFRSCYITCSDDIRKEIIQQLNHTAAPADVTADGSHVPRKEDTMVPKTLPLEVECSDAYGRQEIDVDGKGGNGADEGIVPPRKETVLISTQGAKFLEHNTVVLSAAVSSKINISTDCKAAHTLAKAHDVRHNIPQEHRFEKVLEKAIPNFDLKSSEAQDVEDALDLAIAYLRRVHLFSFYNGCTAATRVADVLNGNHAASTVHLRLQIADEILQQDENKPEQSTAENDPPKKDLLVQRHETYVEKALEEAQKWLEDPSKWESVILSPEKDAAAKNIEKEEEQVVSVWIEDHSVIDEDCRARCSFHSCRKLFKDSTFLRKHLLKKHSEFLMAERAKCHDQAMMEAWDSQETRPVPPVLVDCGRAFSLVPTPILGAADPLAEDPEPELWRREEERREEEEQIRRERQERYQQHSNSDADAPLQTERINIRRSSHFVDVDDMKEEKVELAFDNVEVPLQPPKKKKKKKLL